MSFLCLYFFILAPTRRSLTGRGDLASAFVIVFKISSYCLNATDCRLPLAAGVSSVFDITHYGCKRAIVIMEIPPEIRRVFVFDQFLPVQYRIQVACVLQIVHSSHTHECISRSVVEFTSTILKQFKQWGQSKSPATNRINSRN